MRNHVSRWAGAMALWSMLLNGVAPVGHALSQPQLAAPLPPDAVSPTAEAFPLTLAGSANLGKGLPGITLNIPPGRTWRGKVSLSANVQNGRSGQRVVLLVNGRRVDERTASPYNFTLDTTALADGGYDVSVQVEEGELPLQQVTQQITVDNTPPEVVGLEIGGTGLPGDPASIRLTATGTGSPVTAARLYLGGQAISLTQEADGSFAGMTPPIAETTPFEVELTDEAGNQFRGPVSRSPEITVSPLPRPDGLEPSVTAVGEVRLVWRHTALPPGTRYSVYRVDSAGQETLLGQTTEPYYGDTAAQAGGHYRYSVAVTTPGGHHGPRSPELAVSVPGSDAVVSSRGDSYVAAGPRLASLEVMTSGPTSVSGTISTDTTWTAENGPYLVTGTVSVASGVTLAVEPGTVVKFSSGTSLKVSGNLHAAGLPEAPVIFTSSADDNNGGDTNGDSTNTLPAAGNWVSLEAASGGTVVLQYAQVLYGGASNAAVYSSGGTVQVENSTVSYSSSRGVQVGTGYVRSTVVSQVANAGIYLAAGAPEVTGNSVDGGTQGIYVYSGSPVITGNQITNSTSAGIAFYGYTADVAGTLTGNTVTGSQGYAVDFALSGRGIGALTAGGNTFVGNVYNGYGLGGSFGGTTTLAPLEYPFVLRSTTVWGSLTVQAGTTFKALPGTNLTNNGTFNLNGTAVRPILFVSVKDDTAGGDTNNDGATTAPAPADWEGLILSMGSTNASYVNLRHGGARNVQVDHRGGIADLRNFTVTDAKFDGFLLRNGATLSGAFVRNVGCAVRVPRGNSPVIQDSDLAGGWEAIYVDSSQPSIRNNQLGGPIGVNLYGWNATPQPTITGNTIAGTTNAGVYASITNAYLAGVTLTGNRIEGGGDAVRFNFDSAGLGSNTIDSNTFTGNLINAYKLTGFISRSTTLYPLEYPYVPSLTVNRYETTSPITLAVNPGTVLKFAGTGISVYGPGGSLDVRGTADQKVVLTSIKDDSVGGDTNGDGTLTSPAPGDWTQLYSRKDGIMTLDHARVLYGGPTQSAMLYLSGSALQFTQSELGHSIYDGVWITGQASRASTVASSSIHDHPHYGLGFQSLTNAQVNGNEIFANNHGIYTIEASPSVDNNAIYSNTTGLYNMASAGWPVPKLRNNEITGNGKGALNYATSPTIDARFNWWGSEAGPADSTSPNGIDGTFNLGPWVGREYQDARQFGGTWWSMQARRVNLVTGDWTHSVTDLAVNGRKGFPIQLTRTYHSLGWGSGSFGHLWTFNLELGLRVEESQVTVVYGSGQQARFKANADGSFSAPPGDRNTLVRGADGTWTLTTPNQSVYQFDAAGKATTARDANGNMTTFTYDTAGLLASITDAGGRIVSFTRDTVGRITKMTDPSGSFVTYAYNSAGELESVTDVLGQTTKYAYDSDHRLLSITGPDNVVITRVEYDGETRVSAVYDALNNKVSYAYDPVSRTTRVTDPRGYVTTTVYDAELRVLTVTDPLGFTETRAYDSHNNVISVKNKAGGTTTFTYDARHNLLSQTDTLGQLFSYTYDVYNNLTSETNPLQATTQHAYDARQNRISTTDPLGRITSFAYDLSGLLTSVTDPRGAVYRMEYDAVGNLTATIDPLGQRTTFTNDALGRVTSETDPLLGQTSYELDAAGRLLSTTDPLGGITRYTYDPYARVLTTTDPELRVWENAYDLAGRQTSVTAPLGQVYSYAYDAAGNRTSETDPLGHVTQFGYSARNELIDVTDPLLNTIAYAYDASGNKTAVTDARGNQTTFTYDLLNRLTKVTEPDQVAVETTAYDALGRVTSRTDGNNHTRGYTYDLAGQLREETDPLGKVTRYEYDGAGNRTALVDALNHRSEYTYDLKGQLTAVKLPSGDSYQYGYDALGRHTQTTNPNQHVEVRTFDALGRLTKGTDPAGSVTEHTYDKVGNLLTTLDAAGITTTYTYDQLNRRTGVSTSTGIEITYTYDAAGRRTGMTDEDGPTSFEYDASGRLIKVTTPDLRSVSYGYDAAGNVTQVTDYAGQIVTRTYDKRNRLTSVTTPDSLSTQYTYDAADRWLTVTYPGGMKAEATYDAADRLTQLVNRRPDATLYDSFGYTYDAIGQRTSVQDNLGLTQYAYDVNNRLATVTEPDGSTTQYTYDGAGNRLTRDVTPLGGTAATTSYAYDARNWLTGVTNPDSSVVTYTYDANGNMTGDGEKTYEYDSLNRLRSVMRGTETLATYRYNGDGLRTQKVAGGVTTRYYYDGDRILNEGDGSAITATNVWGAGLIRRTAGGQTGYFLFNVHQDVVGLVDPAGVDLASYRYDAFGEHLESTGTFDNPFRYTAEPYDPETGAIYLRARYYMPAIGRFITQDSWKGTPSIPWTQHLYVYVGNDPVNFSDPTGHCVSGTGCETAEGGSGYSIGDHAVLASLSGASERYQFTTCIQEELKNGAAQGVGCYAKWSDRFGSGIDQMSELGTLAVLDASSAAFEMSGPNMDLGVLKRRATLDSDITPDSFVGLFASVKNNPTFLAGKSATQIADMFTSAGHKVTVRQSTQGSGTATVIDINGAPINQIRIATGQGRHGVPYVAVKGNGINYKIVTGPKSQYIGNPGAEKATFFWVGGN